MTQVRNVRSGNKTTVAALKEELRRRKLAVSGKKSELVVRLQQHTLKCASAIIIQRAYRQKLVLAFLACKGPALKDRASCKNKRDFYTMVDVASIPLPQFISYADSSGSIYAFDILSFLNLRLNAEGKVRNPYTNTAIPEAVQSQVRQAVRVGRCIGYRIGTTIQYGYISDVQKIVDFFQELTSLSFTLNHRWLSSMSLPRLRQFYRCLDAAWRYGFFGSEVKARICPPHGLLYTQREMDSAVTLDKSSTLAQILRGGCRLVGGNSIDDQKMGATMFLCVLTRLSPQARYAMPWLYDLYDDARYTVDTA